MDVIESVSVAKQANVYFDGKVISRTVLFSDGTKKTLGVVLPGEYEFSTSQGELMQITSGCLWALLPESREWQAFEAGTEFSLAANVSFKIKSDGISEYCCSYL